MTTEFRNYVDSALDAQVSTTYRLNHTLQTLAFVKKQKEEHMHFRKGTFDVWDIFHKLTDLIDESDPDNDKAQIFHAFQTAEALRTQCPDEDWLHLVGLIHDLGKVLLLPAFGGLPQWAVVGDTFPVGCAFSNNIVKSHYFADNPDHQDSALNSEYGIYEPNCGLENVHFSWGHDEYMYQVLVHNKSSLPPIGLSVIRFHSFYAWHRDGEYRHLMSDSDHELLKWVQKFNKGDLYSKGTPLHTQEEINELSVYYRSLITKYFPTPLLEW
jgi:inositol oxygenase